MLDRALVQRIETLTGEPILSMRPVHGGYTPALRLVCQTARRSFFVKIGATPLTAEFLRREIHVYGQVSGGFLPKFIAADDHPTQPMLIIEDLSALAWPPPWTDARVEQVAARIGEMHRARVSLAPFEEVHGPVESAWQRVADEPRPFLALGLVDERWLNAALPRLIDHEARCQTAGDSLTHQDLRSDNMCLTAVGAIFVDWNHACLANPKLDLGFWLPSLAYEGGPPPERLLPDEPEIAVWVAGYFAAQAGLPGIPDAPRVRLVQRQQLTTALPWAARALGLPPS